MNQFTSMDAPLTPPTRERRSPTPRHTGWAADGNVCVSACRVWLINCQCNTPRLHKLQCSWSHALFKPAVMTNWKWEVWWKLQQLLLSSNFCFHSFFYLLLRYNGVLVNGTLHWVTAEWQVFFPSPTPFPSPYSSCPLRSRAFAWNNACLALCFYSTFLRFHLLFVYVLSPWFGLCPFKMLLQWRLLGLYYNYRLLAQRKTTLSLSIHRSISSP